MFNPTIINLHKRSPAMFLGDLEAKIIELIWLHGRVTVKELTGLLESEKIKRSPNTIMTITKRLVTKELLSREIGIKDSTFFATEDREVFEKRMAKIINKKITTNLPAPISPK